MTDTLTKIRTISGDDFLNQDIDEFRPEWHKIGGKWKINRRKPVSLDYTNPQFGYLGNSSTGTAYWVLLDDIRTDAGLEHWLRHLSEKVWFDLEEFLAVRDQALQAKL